MINPVLHNIYAQVVLRDLIAFADRMAEALSRQDVGGLDHQLVMKVTEHFEIFAADSSRSDGP